MSTCSHPKRLHATRDDALTHVKQLLWRNNVENKPERSKGLGVYPCDQTTGWHVGHAHGQPPVYHYTFGYYLDAILKADRLRVPLERKLEPKPLLWFSRNPEWEYSVWKATRKTCGPRNKWRTVNEIVGQGMVRFVVPAVYAKLRWSDYLALNPMPTSHRDVMALHGNPVDWLATDEDVPLDVCARDGDSGAQVYFRGNWCNVADVDPDVYDRYLKSRPMAYARAEQTLGEKVMAMKEEATTLRLTTDEWLVANDIDHDLTCEEGVQVLRARFKKAGNS